MERSDGGWPAEDVRFVTEPDGSVMAEHVETGVVSTGESATEALESLREALRRRERDESSTHPSPDAAGAESEPDAEPESNWEWVDADSIEEPDT